MNIYMAKRIYLIFNPDGQWFDRGTMKFFGDTLKNFGVKRISKTEVEIYRKHSTFPGSMDVRHTFDLFTGEMSTRGITA